jgi:integrase
MSAVSSWFRAHFRMRSEPIAKEKGQFLEELPKIKMRTVWGRSLKMSNSDATLIASKMKEGSDPKDVLIILRGTGMRPSECYSMRWELVNWEGLYYQNPHGKTKTAKRSVPLLDQAIPVLKRRHLAQGMPREGWVFPSDAKGGHILNISKAFREARKAAGLPNNLVLYTSRHGNDDRPRECSATRRSDAHRRPYRCEGCVGLSTHRSDRLAGTVNRGAHERKDQLVNLSPFCHSQPSPATPVPPSI